MLGFTACSDQKDESIVHTGESCFIDTENKHFEMEDLIPYLNPATYYDHGDFK